MMHLRHLSDDVFKSVALLTGLNLFLLGGVTILLTANHGLCAIVSLSGIALTLGGRLLLRRHRIYYLEMLAKKSLLEMQLGFYERKFTGTSVDFALPWRLKPEVVTEISKDFDGWVQKSVRSKGTMSRVYFLIYEAVIFLYSMSLCWSLWRMFT